MAKIIRLTAKNGAIKEMPFVGKFKLDPQFLGAKVEVIDSVTGSWVSAVKVRIRGKNVDLSYSEDAQTDEANPEVAAESQSSSNVGLKDGSNLSDLDTGDTGGVGASASQQPSAALPSGGLSGATIALGVLWLGALGGIVAAGGGSNKTPPPAPTPPAAPTALDLASADDAGASNSDNITSQTSGLTISGTAEANARVELFDGTNSLGTATANASGAFSLDVTLAAGARLITAKATNAAGNVSVASAALTITVDATAPTAPISVDLASADDTGSSDSDNVTSQTSALTITGQAEANARVELFDGTNSLGTTTANASGAFSLDVTLAAGARLITAKATDIAGNVSAASTALTITVDATAPDAPTALDLASADDTGASNSDNITSQTSALTITGQAEANARVELFDGTTSLGTTTASGTGAFSLDVTLAAGTRSITAKATDAAGSVSVASSALAITVDTTAPAAPTGLDLAATDDTGSSNSDNVTSQTSGLTISGTAEANALVELFNGTTSLGATTADATTGAFSLDVTLAAGTTSNITARATDAAGNASAVSTALAITVDTTVNVTGKIVAGPAVADHGLSVDIYLGNGTLLVSGIKVNADGSFTANNLPINAGDVIFARVKDSSAGADYLDEATGVAIDLNAVLLATKVAEGTSVTMNINPLTTIAAIKAGLAADGSGTIANAAAATNANTATAQAFGLSGIDITTTSVVATNSGDYTSGDGLTPGEKIGAVLAVLSGMDSLNSGDSQATITSLIQSIGSNGQLTGQGQESLMKGAAAAENRVDGSLQNLVSDSLAASSPETQVTINAIATDNIITGNEVANLTLSGTVSSGATGVSVLLGTKTFAASVSGTTWSYTLSTADIAELGADGVKVIQAQAALPNAASATASRLVTLKLVPPAVPTELDLVAADDTGLSNSDNITNKTSGLTITGKAEASALVELFDGTNSLGTTTADAITGAFSLDVALAAGARSITAKATDIAGNVSAASAALAITVDATAPGAPFVLDLAAVDDTGSSNSDNVTSQTSGLTITGSVFGGANKPESNALVELFNGTTSLGTTTANASGAFSIEVTLAAGVYSITAKATDIAGNVSAASAALAITVDTTAPAAPTALNLADGDDTGLNNDNITSQTSGLTISGKAGNNATVELFDGATSLGTTTANGSGDFTRDVTLAAGTRSITAREIDSAGNASVASAALAITVDTTAPAAPTGLDLITADDTGASSTDNLTNKQSVKISGTAEAGATVELFNGTNSLGTTTANGSGDFSLDVTLAAGTTSNITAKATDLAGNESAASTALTITVDSTAPDAPTGLDLITADDTGASSTDNLTNKQSVKISGTAEAGATVELFDNGASLGTTTADAITGAFSLDVALAAGARSITAKATDIAGNVSAASSALAITVDATAPGAPFVLDLAAVDDTGSSNSDNVTSQTSGLTITGSVFGGANKPESNALVELFNGTTSLGTTTANASGAFSIEVTLAAGVYSITAKATDKAGNVSAASAALAITVDTTAPAAPTALNLADGDDTGLNNDNITSQTSGLTISGKAGNNATVELFDGATSLGTTTANGSGDFSLDVTLAFGPRSITAKEIDSAGNVSAASAPLVITVLISAINLTDIASGIGGIGGIGGFVINGAAVGDQSGWSVSSAGDVNGDGLDDLIVGTRNADPNGNYSGASYVVFGKAGGTKVELSALGTGGFVINGAAAYDQSGFSVRSAGDVNGDGFDDLIVGAYGADPNGTADSGASYVVFGKAGGTKVELSAIASGTSNLGFVINGATAGDRSGYSVSSAGDVNGDGLDDLIIGVPSMATNGTNSGGAFVVFGKRDDDPVNLSAIASGNGALGFVILGLSAQDNLGHSVSSAGDVNGDGLDDLIVGAILASPNGIRYAGASYVVFGKANNTSVNLSALGTGGFVINGAAAYDLSGCSVSSAGDVNGDGLDDLIVGARNADPNGNSFSGASYVVFGKANSAPVNLTDIASGNGGFAINGAGAGHQSGGSVSSAGDVNGDGFDDVIVGAKNADPNGILDSGASYVVFGKTDGAKVELSALGTKGFVINEVAARDFSGRSVSSAGDVNGDGFDDLIVGAYGADPNGNSYSGASYVVYGGNFTGSVTQLGTTGNDILSGTAGDDVIFGGRGDDVITGNGGIDRIAGGTGNDTLIISNANFGRVDGGADTDTLRLAGAFTLDLSALAAVAIKDIEVIDLVAGSLNNILTVTQQTLMNLSTTTNRLMVLGGSGDTVNAFGFTLDTGSATDNGITYTTYTNGAAKLWVQQGVNVDTTPPPSAGFFSTSFDSNDMLIVDDANFLGVDGGAGTDILPMAGTSGFGLDLSTLTPGAINDIEPIDLVAGELNNMLTITQQTLLDFSTTSDHLTFTQSGSGDTQIGFGADTSMMVEGYLPAKLTDFLTSTPSSLIVL